MMERLGEMYDIISKMDFFNQRAARELWSHKPEKIQNQDIFNRHQDLCEIKEFVDDVAELMELEEQGLLLKLPESDWNDLIKQLAIIIANDFIVYCDEREFIINQFFSLEYDEELRFSATCRFFNGTENDWWCDEECEHGEDGKGCNITFTFSDIGKTVFLTKEEALQKLKELENE